MKLLVLRIELNGARGTSGAGRRLALLAALALSAFAATACFQQNNTYPVEILKEMHYAQAHRPQEAPRQDVPLGTVAFASAGAPEDALTISGPPERPYQTAEDVARAGELYRVNCSMCHGTTGHGDSRAVPHITSPDSWWTSSNQGAAYPNPPPDLTQSRQRLTKDNMVSIVTNGIILMPRFGALLTEEEIRDIVNYIRDEQNGLGVN